MIAIETVRALLTRFGRRVGSRAWIGCRPEGSPRKAAMIVAAEVGYPAAPKVFGAEDLIEVDRPTAAGLLAFFAKASLAYGPYSIRAGLRRACTVALADLAPEARFFTNGWTDGSSWKPLSNATFDGGVIGLDDQNAFIFWVEEED